MPLTVLKSYMKDLEITGGSRTDAKQPAYWLWYYEAVMIWCSSSQIKNCWFYRSSRTSAPITSDPTLFLSHSPHSECWTLTSHVDPCWLRVQFMTLKTEQLTQTMCMSVQDSCQAILSSHCRPNRSPLRVLWEPAHHEETNFCCGRCLAFLFWVFNPKTGKSFLFFHFA